MPFLQNFYDTKVFDEWFNALLLTFISKNHNPITLNEYRLISLIGYVYKVVTKVLANRLRMLIEEVVGPNQFAFIKGR